MNLSFTTTPEQDAALNALNLKSNPDGKTAVEDFTASLVSEYLNGFVAQAKADRVNSLIQQIQESKDTLTDDDVANLSSTLAERVSPTPVTPTPKL
jgi:hypothetical protein